MNVYWRELPPTIIKKGYNSVIIDCLRNFTAPSTQGFVLGAVFYDPYSPSESIADGDILDLWWKWSFSSSDVNTGTGRIDNPPTDYNPWTAVFKTDGTPPSPLVDGVSYVVNYFGDEVELSDFSTGYGISLTTQGSGNHSLHWELSLQLTADYIPGTTILGIRSDNKSNFKSELKSLINNAIPNTPVLEHWKSATILFTEIYDDPTTYWYVFVYHGNDGELIA